MRAVLALSLVIPVGCSSAQVYPYPDDGIEPCERPCPPPHRRKSPLASLGQGLLYTVAVVPGVVAIAALSLADALEPNPCQPVPVEPADGP